MMSVTVKPVKCIPHAVAPNRTMVERIRASRRPKTLDRGTQMMFPRPRTRTLNYVSGVSLLLLSLDCI